MVAGMGSFPVTSDVSGPWQRTFQNWRDLALRYIVLGNPLPLPVKPSRAELLVLTALVQTYGPLLFGDAFGLARRPIVKRGAVVLLQQLVFADAASTGCRSK